MRHPASAEPQFFDDLSREVALACDAGGTLTWVDPRARNVLAANPGQTLRGLAAQGTEEKVDRLLVQAREEKVEGWKLILYRDQVPTTVRSTDEARRVLERMRPAAMVLDVMLEGETSWGFSHELKEAERSRLAKETAAILAKHTLSREVAITRIRDALSKAGLGSQALLLETSRRG